MNPQMDTAWGLLSDMWREMTWFGRVTVWPVSAVCILATELVLFVIRRAIFKERKQG